MIIGGVFIAIESSLQTSESSPNPTSLIVVPGW